jgi:hypothetical protein
MTISITTEKATAIDADTSGGKGETPSDRQILDSQQRLV